MINGTTNAREFDAEHGDNPICLNGWLYFSDGCYREVNPLGARVTPTDPYQRAKLVVKYWELKVDLALEEFTNFKQKLLFFTNNCHNRQICAPPPENDAIAKLESLKLKVQDYRLELQQAEENVKNNKPDEMVRREEVNDQLRKKCEDVLEKIRAVEI